MLFVLCKGCQQLGKNGSILKQIDEAELSGVRASEVANGLEKHRPDISAWRRLLAALTLRNAALCLAALAMVPAALSVLYRIDGVRPVSTLMLGRWLTFQSVDRRWVEIEDIAPSLIQAVVMSEDGQFCAHHGVDLAELNGVIDDAMEGEKVRGASTITMQTAKNLFLWNGRLFIRKAAEIPLAIYMDLVLPKRRIMEIYLNIAEWDEGVFGIEAAAQQHFKRPASKLTARQAALLAVTLPAPTVRNPAKPKPGMQRLAGLIERRAAKSGSYVGCVE